MSFETIRSKVAETHGQQKYAWAREKVVERLLQKKAHQKTISAICLWNQDKSLTYNAKVLGVAIDTAWSMMKRYNLRCRDGRFKLNGGGQFHRGNKNYLGQIRGAKGRWE